MLWLDTFPAILSNSFIQQLKSELSQLEAQRKQLAGRLGAKHPEMLKVTAAIESARVKLDAELAKVVHSVQNEYLAAEAAEQSLIAALNAQKNDALAQNRKGIDYGALQETRRRTAGLFEGLLQRARPDIPGSRSQQPDGSSMPPRSPGAPCCRSEGRTCS